MMIRHCVLSFTILALVPTPSCSRSSPRNLSNAPFRFGSRLASDPSTSDHESGAREGIQKTGTTVVHGVGVVGIREVDDEKAAVGRGEKGDGSVSA